MTSSSCDSSLCIPTRSWLACYTPLHLITISIKNPLKSNFISSNYRHVIKLYRRGFYSIFVYFDHLKFLSLICTLTNDIECSQYYRLNDSAVVYLFFYAPLEIQFSFFVLRKIICNFFKSFNNEEKKFGRFSQIGITEKKV